MTPAEAEWISRLRQHTEAGAIAISGARTMGAMAAGCLKYWSTNDTLGRSGYSAGCRRASGLICEVAQTEATGCVKQAARTSRRAKRRCRSPRPARPLQLAPRRASLRARQRGVRTTAQSPPAAAPRWRCATQAAPRWRCAPARPRRTARQPQSGAPSAPAARKSREACQALLWSATRPQAPLAHLQRRVPASHGGVAVPRRGLGLRRALQRRRRRGRRRGLRHGLHLRLRIAQQQGQHRHEQQRARRRSRHRGGRRSYRKRRSMRRSSACRSAALRCRARRSRGGDGGRASARDVARGKW
jgi:hypothetical protein